MRSLALLLLGVLFSWSAPVAPALADDAPAVEAARLFVIERSLNGNRVAYDWQQGGDPIRAYWLLEEGGTEELSSLEWSFAYGATVESSDEAGARFTLEPLPERTILVERVEGRPTAVTEIGGRQCRLDRVWVKVSSGFLLPSVDFVVLHGRALDDGSSCTERIED